MTIVALEILVEERSAEVALTELMPRIAPGVPFAMRPFNGKPDLLRRLPQRMVGYAGYARGAGLGIVVLADRDDDDCAKLKATLEGFAVEAGLPTLSTAVANESAIVANRVACEELEAWFFGDVAALVKAFPGVPASLAEKAPYRDSDAIKGGTAEALEKVLQDHGHHRAGLNKGSAAVEVATHMDVENNRSASFNAFRDGVRRLVGGDH